MKELRGKTVLVTGAASGIGRETALAFAREGSILLLVDINETELQEAALEVRSSGVDCRAHVVDVSSREQVDRLAAQVASESGGLDVLVNNAGVFVWADFLDTTLEDWEWMTGVNLWGPVYTMRAFLPGMIARGGGNIVNIASGGGLVTLPCLSAYSATKFALVGLSETLQHEVRRHNIVVTTICPGSTKTPIIKNIRVRGLDRQKLENVVFPIMNRYPSSKVAAVIVDAVKRDRRLVVITAQIKAMVYIKRLSPALYGALVRPFTRLFYSRMR